MIVDHTPRKLELAARSENPDGHEGGAAAAAAGVASGPAAEPKMGDIPDVPIPTDEQMQELEEEHAEADTAED